MTGGQKQTRKERVWRLMASALPRRYELSLELTKVKTSKKSGLPSWPQLPMWKQMYFASVIVFGILLLLLEWGLHPVAPSLSLVGELVYLAVGVQLAAMMPLKMESGIHNIKSLFLMAAGLVAPGLGVSLVAWLTGYDGRRPGRDIPIYAFLYNGANYAITYGVMTLALGGINESWFWALPVKTLLLTVLVILTNSTLTASAISVLSGQKFWGVLKGGLGNVTMRSLIIMGALGGLLVVVLMQRVGYVMGLAIFGALVAIRSNTADAQAQALEREQTLQLAAQALDARDHYTKDHSSRVAEMAVKIGEAMGLRGRDQDRLRTAAVLHDLGKIGIRDAVLNSLEKLTNEEWEILKTHPTLGADMIVTHSALAALAPMVRSHHERFDGKGYPDGLAGESIPLGARIIAVADSFDTITGERLYRRSSMTLLEALEDIKGRAGTWYDPQVVNGLLKVHETMTLEAEAQTTDTGGEEELIPVVVEV